MKYCCFNFNVIVRTEKAEESGEWFTEKQIMSFNGYHDENDSNYLTVKSALLEGLEEREHERPALALLGFKQYKYMRSKTVNESGKRKEDIHLTTGELNDKQGERLAKAFDGMKNIQPVADGPAMATVSIEPWKKEALDLEKRLSACSAKASKLISTGQSTVLKLYRHCSAVPSDLGQAQRINLEEKVAIITKALQEFTTEISKVDSKTPERAAEQEALAGPAMATLKQHNAMFEKVLNLAKNFLSMFD